MRTHRPIAALTLAAAMAGLLGCSVGAPPPATAPAPGSAAQTAPGASTDSAPAPPVFDPAKWSPPETGPSPEAERVLASLPDPARVPLPADLAAPPPRAPSSSAPRTPPPARGCRAVQVLATGDRSRADAVSRSAASRFGVPASVSAGNGLYRVRIGGCLDEQRAAALRERALRAGYEGAFVVTTAE